MRQVGASVLARQVARAGARARIPVRRIAFLSTRSWSLSVQRSVGYTSLVNHRFNSTRIYRSDLCVEIETPIGMYNVYASAWNSLKCGSNDVPDRADDIFIRVFFALRPHVEIHHYCYAAVIKLKYTILIKMSRYDVSIWRMSFSCFKSVVCYCDTYCVFMYNVIYVIIVCMYYVLCIYAIFFAKKS